MVSPTPDSSTNIRTDAEQLGKLARTVSQERSIHAAVGMGFGLAVVTTLYFASKYAGNAVRAGAPLPAGISVGVIAICTVAIIWMCTSSYSRWIERVASRLGSVGGYVDGTAESAGWRRGVGVAVSIGFAVSVPIHVGLSTMEVLPVELSLPISAMYVAPFVAGISIATRNPALFVFPLTYGACAAASVAGYTAGFPAWFRPMETALAMGASVISTLLAGLCMRLYTLKRMRRLSRRGFKI